MGSKKITALLRRKKEGKTDYRKRLSLLKSGELRLVIRKSNKNMIVQLVAFHPDGDKVLVTAHSSELQKQGWKLSKSNLPAAYLVGLILGKKALAKKQKRAIVDLGLQSAVKGTRLYAVLKGALDAGMDIPNSPDVLPSDARLSGEHIAAYAVSLVITNDSKRCK